MEVSMAQTNSTKPTRKQPGVRYGSEDLAGEVADLLALDATALRQKWLCLPKT